MCASPRPESLAHLTPSALRTGTSTSVVESDTPPVECLSANTPPPCGRGKVSPLSVMASVRFAHSLSVMPFKSTAMQNAAICESVASSEATARQKNRNSSRVSSALFFFRSITSNTLIRGKNSFFRKISHAARFIT